MQFERRKMSETQTGNVSVALQLGFISYVIIGVTRAVTVTATQIQRLEAHTICLISFSNRNDFRHIFRFKFNLHGARWSSFFIVSTAPVTVNSYLCRSIHDNSKNTFGTPSLRRYAISIRSTVAGSLLGDLSSCTFKMARPYLFND